MARSRETMEAVAELARLSLAITLHIIRACPAGGDRTKLLLEFSKAFTRAKDLMESQHA